MNVIGGEKSVGSIFDQFGGTTSGEEDRRFVDEQRPVELPHHAPSPLVVGADYDAIRVLEVLDCRALAQKLRVGDDGEVGIGARPANDAVDIVIGSDRDRRFDGDPGELPNFRCDLARGIVDVRQVGKAIAAPRRGADGEEYGVGGSNGGSGTGREGQSAGFDIARDQGFKPRLEDRNAAVTKLRNLACVSVDASHHMPEIGKAGAGDQPHVTGADHCYAHRSAVRGPQAWRLRRSRSSLILTMSAATISVTNLSKLVRCRQPSLARAFAASPTRESTSVGRK